MNPNDEAAVSAAMTTMAAPYEARVRELEAERDSLLFKLDIALKALRELAKHRNDDSLGVDNEGDGGYYYGQAEAGRVAANALEKIGTPLSEQAKDAHDNAD